MAKAQLAGTLSQLQDFAQNLHESLRPQAATAAVVGNKLVAGKEAAASPVAAKEKATRKSDEPAGRLHKRKGDTAKQSSGPQPAEEAVLEADAASAAKPSSCAPPVSTSAEISAPCLAAPLPSAAEAENGAQALAIGPANSKSKPAEKTHTVPGLQPATAPGAAVTVPTATDEKSTKAGLPALDLHEAAPAPGGKLEPMAVPFATAATTGNQPAAPAVRSAAPASLPAAAPAAPAAQESYHLESHTFVVSPNVLEVGLSAGAHGWLRVRAEMDGAGQVSAQVTAGSAAAAAQLGKEVPAMQTYLAGEQVGLSALVVNAAEASFGASNAAAGDAGNGSKAHQERPGEPFPGANLEEADQANGDATFAFGQAALPAALLRAGHSGGWLSVRV